MQNLSALFLAGLVVGLSTPAMADTVLSVGDGDTLTVTGTSGRRTIRLACVDAPETAQTPYGYAARAALQQLVPVGSNVQIKVGDTDRYGRTVARAQELLREGHTYLDRDGDGEACESLK